jgi:hypothetical protein
MALPNRMSLRPGLLWLTLNLDLIIQCLSWNNIFIFLNFTYPLRCLRVTPGVHVPQVEYHCSKASCLTSFYSICTVRCFSRCKVAGAWSWPLIPICFRGLVWVEVSLHAAVCFMACTLHIAHVERRYVWVLNPTIRMLILSNGLSQNYI